jgi:hypothetical protein
VSHVFFFFGLVAQKPAAQKHMHALHRTCSSSRGQRSVAQTKPSRWTCFVGHRRAHVLGGGSLPVRRPVVPVDCAKLHALWSAGIARWSARRASGDFGEIAGSSPSPSQTPSPSRFVPTPKKDCGSLACSRGRGGKVPPKKDVAFAEFSELHITASATAQK